MRLSVSGQILAPLVYGIAAIALGLSFFSAWQIRAALPNEPLSWPDSLSYLSPGIVYESTGIWVASVRQFLYPLFLYAIAHLSGKSSTIASVQHWAALLSGLVLLVAWLVLLNPIRPFRLLHAVCSALGVVLVCVMWHSPVLLLYECYIMPEIFFLVGSSVELLLIALLAWELARPVIRPLPYGIVLAALIILSVGLYYIMPRWGLSATIMPAVALLASWFRRYPLKTILVPAALGCMVAFVLFPLPEALLRKHATPNSPYFMQMHLFAIHANIISRELQLEGSNPASHFDPVLLRRCDEAIQRELQRSRANPTSNFPWPTLGFRPDMLIYEDDSVISIVAKYYTGDGVAAARFFTHFYQAAWLHQPYAMLSKVSNELRTSYYSSPSRGFALSRYEYPLLQFVQESLTVAREPGRASMLQQSVVWKNYDKHLAEISSGGRMEHTPAGLFIERGFGLFFLPLVLLVLVLTAVATFIQRRSAEPAPELLVCLVTVCWLLPAAGSNLTVSIIHSIWHQRYLETNFVLSLTNGFALVAAALVCATIWIGRLTSKKTAT